MPFLGLPRPMWIQKSVSALRWLLLLEKQRKAEAKICIYRERDVVPLFLSPMWIQRSVSALQCLHQITSCCAAKNVSKLSRSRDHRQGRASSGCGRAANSFVFYLDGSGAELPRSPACWLSRSTICCSRSISMMSGTTNTKNVVPAIHAALPVLHISFWLKRALLLAALLAFWYNDESASPLAHPPPFSPLLSTAAISPLQQTLCSLCPLSLSLSQLSLLSLCLMCPLRLLSVSTVSPCRMRATKDERTVCELDDETGNPKISATNTRTLPSSPSLSLFWAFPSSFFSAATIFSFGTFEASTKSWRSRYRCRMAMS